MLPLFAYSCFGLKQLTFYFIEFARRYLIVIPMSSQSAFLYYRKLYSTLKIVWKETLLVQIYH